MKAALNLLLITFFLLMGGSAFEVSPENPQTGDVLTVSGTGLTIRRHLSEKTKNLSAGL
jgi:hypothetical protein